MLITISGLSGSGKSSAAKGLAAKLGYKTIDVGGIFREMAAAHGMDVIAFGPYALEHPEIDRELDAEMLRRARKGQKLILQGRLAGLLTAQKRVKAVRFWVDASLKVRASRTARREGISFEKARKNIMKRDRANRLRYLATYGLDLNDRSVYDAVVRTDNLTIEEVVSCLETHLTHVWKRPRTPLKKPSRRKPRPPSSPSPKRRSRSLR